MSLPDGTKEINPNNSLQRSVCVVQLNRRWNVFFRLSVIQTFVLHLKLACESKGVDFLAKVAWC